MIGRPNSLSIVLGLILLSINALILFVLIPKASSQIRGLYSQNQYADGYDQLAANLAAGNGYRFYPDTAQTLMREPGYPLLLAGIYKVFGNSFAVVELLNMILAFGVAFLMTLIARRVSRNSLLIFGSPLLFLFHPETWSRKVAEALKCFLPSCSLCMFTVYNGNEQTMARLCNQRSGTGCDALVRSTPILFPVVLFGYLAFVEREGGALFRVIQHFVLVIFTMFVVISLWIIRNYLLTQKFVPTASVLGVSAQTGLYLSTHPQVGNVQVEWQASLERNRLAHELGYPFRVRSISTSLVRQTNLLFRSIFSGESCVHTRRFHFCYENAGSQFV